jgi:hypothetical protein
MTGPTLSRPDKTTDLTRWNRAGLRRFDYVDGDAAIWLEELRLALFGLYLRGEPVKDRLPETWRDLFMRPTQDWPSPARLDQTRARVDWARVAPARPPQPESRGQRKARLLAQYMAAPDGDHAWEIARAFARAAHVVLGHADAFANEGYLRTATQWDSLRRLAAMVNYQPGPPASASTVVALSLLAGGSTITLPKGLGAKYTPLAGGTPLIFETLAPTQAHPDLNAVRSAGWNINASPLPLGPLDRPQSLRWLTGPKTEVNPGDLAVLSFGPAGHEAYARSVTDVVRDAGTALIGLDRGTDSPIIWGQARLWTRPDAVRVGEARTGNGRIVAQMAAPVSVAVGDLVQIADAIGTEIVEVIAADAGKLVLQPRRDFTGTVDIRPLAPFAIEADGYAPTGAATDRMFFAGPNGVTETSATSGADFQTVKAQGASSQTIGYRFRASGGRGARGYTYNADATPVAAVIEIAAAQVLAQVSADPDRTVTFTGKPPKSLALGGWFVARALSDGSMRAVRVIGISSGPGVYHILFHTNIGGLPDKTEFHGPMIEALAPQFFNRNPDPALQGNVALLTDLSDAAQLLLKPGRQMIVSRTTPDGLQDDALASIAAVARPANAAVRITLQTDADLRGWAAGDTVYRLNTADLGHGDGKGPRLLGSGDAERPLQAFALAVRDISHIASAAAGAGVVPDMDVAVDGVVWPWCDYGDVTAEGARAWSSLLTEDGEITVQFRRRLPTGSNNVAVLRHRVGTGVSGSGIPAHSFTKPSRKHPQVTAIHQPFPTSGGANRETVAALRVSAPSRLAANGRAVSLRDFERLASLHAGLWAARATEIPSASPLRELRLTVVPAGGAPLTAALQNQLRPAILANAIPGVRLGFQAYQPLYLHISAQVRADLASFDPADVKAAAEAALLRAFALQVRRFAQPVYVAEILAVLEAVPQVETALASFDLGPGYDLTRPEPSGFAQAWPANVAIRDGGVAALFPGADQVAHLAAPGQPGPQGTCAVDVVGLT